MVTKTDMQLIMSAKVTSWVSIHVDLSEFVIVGLLHSIVTTSGLMEMFKKFKGK
jgi:hypothetical protein